MKRTLDILLAGLALLVLAPVLLAVALLVRLDSPGPVLFRQVRVGQERRPFHILKFRSMVVDAEKMGGYSTSDGDRRITRVGRFIRRTSLDELPQLINVLIGDMSIVGPRPDVPAQEALYSPEEWLERHRVRPGITGLAQAKLRSAATPEQRKQLDLEYVRRRSLVLDCTIVLNTVRQVVFKGGN